MYCFKIKMGTAKFKRIINQFSFSGKRRKEAFTFDNDSPSRTSTWLVSSRWNAFPVLKETKAAKFLKNFQVQFAQ